MKFTIFQESRQGARQYNQDRMCYSYSRDSLLLVVADGMGGHLHGEVAAQITVELMAELFQHRAKPTIHNPHAFLIDGFMKCHDAIFNYASNHSLLETPRTTVVAAIVQDGVIFWAHVGDSRLYIFRGGKMQVRTKDHSKVQNLIDQGRLTEEQAYTHPDRNKIYNCLGSLHAPEIDTAKAPLVDGDTVLLCTDGMWGGVSQGDMERMLSTYPVLYSVPQLLDRAELAGGHHCDNLTAVAINWHEDQEEVEGAMSTRAMLHGEVTTQLNTLANDKSLKDSKDITEDDIEAAIKEIQNAIQKYSK